MPSAATIRSALTLPPPASISAPLGLASTPAELSTISAPARRACSASALITVCRTIENTRLPPHRCTEMTLFAVVAHLAGVRDRRALDRRLVGADRFEHAQAVLVDVDARAGGAQRIGALVHAHAPAALRQRAGRGQPGKSGADDFRVPFGHAAMLWHRTARAAL